MSNRVTNLSDLIQRVTASCLTHPVIRAHEEDEEIRDHTLSARIEAERDETEEEAEETEEVRVFEEAETEEVKKEGLKAMEKVKEMEVLMAEVFDAVSAMKKAYVSLQGAHSPWDPERMRFADAAVVAELRRLGRLRERFRRGQCGGGGGKCGGGASLSDAVAPYEAAVEDLKREVKVREAEIECLKEKIHCFGDAKKKKKKSSIRKTQVAAAPTADLFQSSVEQVKSATKSFTSLLLSLMRSARWDIPAAVQSMILTNNDDRYPPIPAVGSHHARYAVESYVTKKAFHGFENESFYMEGSLASLTHPSEFRRSCLSQYRDMRSMDPAELLGILPTCRFGRFAAKKYLSMFDPDTEASLLGDLEHRRVVEGGDQHPRTGFYGGFLAVVKAVWLLHLVAFALDPGPSHFEVGRGAGFEPAYMESVVRLGPADRVGGLVVGFPVSPGFKLAGGSVVKARVYLIPKSGSSVEAEGWDGRVRALPSDESNSVMEISVVPVCERKRKRFSAFREDSWVITVKGMALNKGLSLNPRQERDDAGEMGYCQRIKRSDFWGGESELLVLSKLCCQPIIVYIPEHEHTTVSRGNRFIPIAEYGAEFGKPKKNKKPRQAVKLLYSGSNHYDLLV
ncbi:hypothetical protein QJS10_CPB14g00807 [Acorus calamus]|uniref:OTU domain-containing protein n=1 Tax=Acorus calamus TaxID=4465 RepID=A0AAV9DED1_ACOCL|nr:hypothetical protein QJS10_CPB14g00807 [Acorus calamus]